ncbi:MAG: type IX secretion system membrane protein PorP/SprF [Bacteroidetes bacterium]|nr:type IX secretion system membrane protein PorP/SprF [Bacteroidota bacterium]
MKKIIYTFFLFFANYCLQNTTCFAQAYQFTQFYASPTFLNPAFVGSGNVCSRITTNYRIQWPSIPGAFKTYLLAYDHSISKTNSGIGFIFANDRAGSGNLRSTSLGAQYSYQLTLSRKWAFNAGFEAGYAMRNYDFNKYVFGDQIAYGTPTSIEQSGNDQVQYLDFSSGFVLYSEKIWAGFSARHLNQPNQALQGGISRLPVLYSVHGGYVIPIAIDGEDGASKGKNHSVTTAFNYRSENKFDQVDIGVYYTYYRQLVFGVWYRGIPLLKAYKRGYPNNDAIAFLVGTTIDRFKFGYSYDVTISWLAGYTAGAHEISLSYQFCPSKKFRKSAIPCPKF